MIWLLSDGRMRKRLNWPGNLDWKKSPINGNKFWPNGPTWPLILKRDWFLHREHLIMNRTGIFPICWGITPWASLIFQKEKRTFLLSKIPWQILKHKGRIGGQDIPLAGRGFCMPGRLREKKQRKPCGYLRGAFV